MQQFNVGIIGYGWAATHEVIFAADRPIAEKRPVKLVEVR